jgi:hypothetical protein
MPSKPEKVMIELPDDLLDMSDEQLDALAEVIYRQLKGDAEA